MIVKCVINASVTNAITNPHIKRKISIAFYFSNRNIPIFYFKVAKTMQKCFIYRYFPKKYDINHVFYCFYTLILFFPGLMA